MQLGKPLILCRWMHVYLVQVDYGEPVCLSSSHIPHREVEPLSVLVGVVVKPQVELIIPLAPGEIAHTHQYHTSRLRKHQFFFLWKFAPLITVYDTITYTWMALPRFPLSNLDSKTRVVSSGALVGMVWRGDMLGPAREEINYMYMYNKTTIRLHISKYNK